MSRVKYGIVVKKLTGNPSSPRAVFYVKNKVRNRGEKTACGEFSTAYAKYVENFSDFKYNIDTKKTRGE